MYVIYFDTSVISFIFQNISWLLGDTFLIINSQSNTGIFPWNLRTLFDKSSISKVNHLCSLDGPIWTSNTSSSCISQKWQEGNKWNFRIYISGKSNQKFKSDLFGRRRPSADRPSVHLSMWTTADGRKSVRGGLIWTVKNHTLGMKRLFVTMFFPVHC